jgi:hypothetical protein
MFENSQEVPPSSQQQVVTYASQPSAPSPDHVGHSRKRAAPHPLDSPHAHKYARVDDYDSDDNFNDGNDDDFNDGSDDEAQGSERHYSNRRRSPPRGRYRSPSSPVPSMPNPRGRIHDLVEGLSEDQAKALLEFLSGADEDAWADLGRSRQERKARVVNMFGNVAGGTINVTNRVSG